MTEPAINASIEESEKSPLEGLFKGDPQFSLGFSQFSFDMPSAGWDYVLLQTKSKSAPADIWVQTLGSAGFKSLDALVSHRHFESGWPLAKIVMSYFSTASEAETPVVVATDQVRAVFERNRDRWLAETVASSSLEQMAMHPAYQEIIGLGEAALPLIFTELERRPAFWFWALAAITRHTPDHEEGNFESAREAWLAWGREHEYL